MRYTTISAMQALNACFLRMPKSVLKRVMDRKLELSVRHALSMFTPKGKVRIIDVQLRPWLIDRSQKRFFHRCALLLRSALGQLMPMYLANPKVRQILPLEPKEHEWLLKINSPRLQRPQAVFDRLDATATFARADWRENFFFLEPNSVGIGGIHYIPATCALTEEWVLPTLKRHLPDLAFASQDDIRWLLFKLFIRHAKAIGRRLKRVVLVEDQSVSGGTDEFPQIARYLRRQGLEALTDDPRDLTLRRGEMVAKGKPVDLVYRDSEITEMFEMVKARPKASLAAIEEAFRQNRVISSIAGEFDHKSAWELFTNPEFSRYFSLPQRRFFHAHVLWTRILAERRTTDSQGRSVDLVAFARRHRARLVLKPNRAYGGEGVVFGHEVSQACWEKELEKALRVPYTHVIQQGATVYSEKFPVVAPDGSVCLKPFFAVTGFAASPDGIAFLGRSSQEAVVNVSRKGGLVAIWQLG